MDSYEALLVLNCRISASDLADDINEALETAKIALSKQIAKSPIKERKYFGLVHDYYCPSCGHYFGRTGEYSTLVKDRFCQGEGCGQAIDWGDND